MQFLEILNRLLQTVNVCGLFPVVDQVHQGLGNGLGIGMVPHVAANGHTGGPHGEGLLNTDKEAA